MALGFEMQVVERLVLPGMVDVMLAGPVVAGTCRVGDTLCLTGNAADREVRCTGIELLNWGPRRADWITIRVSDVGIEDVAAVTRASVVAQNRR